VKGEKLGYTFKESKNKKGWLISNKIKLGPFDSKEVALILIEGLNLDERDRNILESQIKTSSLLDKISINETEILCTMFYMIFAAIPKINENAEDCSLLQSLNGKHISFGFHFPENKNDDNGSITEKLVDDLKDPEVKFEELTFSSGDLGDA
jgi:hypothetical protein